MADLINELAGMDDAALGKKLGFSDKVAAFKLDLERADKLQGDGRKKVLSALARMFSPQSYAIEDLNYTIARAEKPAKTTPAGLVQACGCGDYD